MNTTSQKTSNPAQGSLFSNNNSAKNFDIFASMILNPGLSFPQSQANYAKPTPLLELAQTHSTFGGSQSYSTSPKFFGDGFKAHVSPPQRSEPNFERSPPALTPDLPRVSPPDVSPTHCELKNREIEELKKELDKMVEKNHSLHQKIEIQDTTILDNDTEIEALKKKLVAAEKAIKELENKLADKDVVYLGETRPPSRHRSHNNRKRRNRSRSPHSSKRRR